MYRYTTANVSLPGNETFVPGIIPNTEKVFYNRQDALKDVQDSNSIAIYYQEEGADIEDYAGGFFTRAVIKVEKV